DGSAEARHGPDGHGAHHEGDDRYAHRDARDVHDVEHDAEVLTRVPPAEGRPRLRPGPFRFRQLLMRIFSAACFSVWLTAAPAAIAFTSDSGSVGSRRSCIGVGTRGLWTSATRTSAFA